MKCFVLAAGYATRLYPLTENYPKPLLCVKGRPILDWLLDDIDSCGCVDEFVIISNHKYFEHFEKWKEGLSLSAEVTLLDDGSTDNDSRLGAVRDIDFAIKKLSVDDDIMVIAGDNLLDFSLKNFLDFFKEKRSSVVMRYYESNFEKLKKCGIVKCDDADKIIKMEEKSPNPDSNWCVPPFYIYAKTDVPYIEKGISDGCGTDAPGSFIAYLAGKTDVYAMKMNGSRYDIGNLESYEKVQKEYNGIQL